MREYGENDEYDCYNNAQPRWIKYDKHFLSLRRNGPDRNLGMSVKIADNLIIMR